MNLRIKEICSEKGISLQTLANQMGITYQSLHATINGNPTLSRLQELADNLGVGVSELLSDGGFVAMLRDNGQVLYFDDKDKLREYLK